MSTLLYLFYLLVISSLQYNTLIALTVNKIAVSHQLHTIAVGYYYGNYGTFFTKLSGEGKSM